MSIAIREVPTYELRSVTRRYGQGQTEVQAVRDLNLRIDAGEFVAIVGPSGSGKTTLLQLLGALDRPSAGEILFEGRDLAKLREGELTSLRLAALGFVFQQFNLIPTLSAAQNVELALAPRGFDSAKRHEIVEEQQRVAIARALANEPRVVLADEPTGNLDSTTGDEIIALLRELSDDRGQTIVLVTHNAEIAALAGRTIRMQDGALVDGSPSSLDAVEA